MHELQLYKHCVLVIFPVAMVKYLTNGNQRKEEIILASKLRGQRYHDEERLVSQQ